MRYTDIRTHSAVYVFLAVLLLLLPLKWLVAACFSIALHELCHFLALKLFAVRIYEIQITCSGVTMRTEPMKPQKEFLCALAGPASCLIAFALARWFPRFAVCSAFHAAYNLLPIYPSDGGRALYCLTQIFLSDTASNRLCHVAEYFCICAIMFAGLYGSFVLHLGILPILLGCMLTWRALYRKIPCKQAQLGVQ